METTRFDALTTSLTAPHSRRGALRLLGAVLGLGGLVLLEEEPTEAHKRRKRRKGKRYGKGKGKTKDQDTGNGNGKNKDEDQNNDNQQDEDNEQEDALEPVCDFTQGTCCVDSDCRADEICANVNGLRHCFPNPNGGPQFPNGTCAVDDDCRINEICANVNGLQHCFCKPALVCGQVCCLPGSSCANPQTSTCVF
jgi:hypothetical protein